MVAIFDLPLLLPSGIISIGFIVFLTPNTYIGLEVRICLISHVQADLQVGYLDLMPPGTSRVPLLVHVLPGMEWDHDYARYTKNAKLNDRLFCQNWKESNFIRKKAEYITN